MIICLRLGDALNGDIYVDLIDVWYKENYWKLKYPAPGKLAVSTGPYTYYAASRKAVLWDGAGSAILTVQKLDYPPSPAPSWSSGPTKGTVYHHTAGKTYAQGGDHTWYLANDPSQT